jgi:hypothetical protein
MRDRETIDQELRRIALREQGRQASMREIDALLDERLGHRVERSEPKAVAPRATQVLVDSPAPRRLFRRLGLHRYALRAALPLSLLAFAAALLAVFVMHKSDPAPDSMTPAPSSVVPPSSEARPTPAAPVVHTPPLEIADRAFIGALKHDGVPVPSNEYVTAHGHAVCDFLARQPDFAEAVSVLQHSSVWDANQSASVAAGAVVAYCPQYQPSGPAQQQPDLKDALSGLQNIERDLKSIDGDLQGIRDGLPALPGGQ